MKKTLIIIANFLIVLFTIFFVSLYVRNQSAFMQAYNTENFMNMSIGMEQVTTNYLEGEQRLCDSWAACINSRKMNMAEAMDYLNVAQRLPYISAHIIKEDSFTGFSNRPKINAPDDYTVSYKEIDIFSSLNELLGQQDQVRVTRSYTNPINGVQSIAFCDLLELRVDGSDKIERAILMRVIPVEVLASKWVFPSEKYSDAQISIIDREGNYIIKGKSFKNSNFFEFYKSYNQTGKDDLDKLESEIHETGMFTMQNSKAESCIIVHVPVNTSFDWTLLTYIPMTDINKNNIDWPLVIVVSFCLLILLVFDILVIMRFNRKLAAAAQEADSANKAKTDFLSTMSHDIRTPMNAIIGLTTIAEKNVKDSQYVSDNLKKIKLASNHLLTLINDILDISKVERGNISLSPVTFSIVDSAENLVNISQPTVRQKNIDFRFRSKNIKNEYLYADQLRINQIFINILSNALKYTPAGKQVYVDLSELPSEKKGCIKLEYKVSDTGIGMSQDFMEVMYQPFIRQTDSRINTIQGTGLGLAITKKMVDIMGGQIKCESQEGVGTTFTVTLDIEVSSKEESEQKLPPLEVLVIDDDEVLLETACDTLTALGTNPDLAESGETALTKLLAKKEASKSYDVIILDWKMPGANGVELTKKIREIAGNDISILLVSAYDWTQIEEDAKNAGIDGFISKPLFRSSLFKKISEVLGLEDKAASQEENNSDLQDMKVLVAEDMDVNWEVISTLLDMYGIKCKRAENGKVAVDMLRNIQPAEYDLVFMDIQMPVMNGLEATRQIRKLENPYAAGIPIIAMTADAFSENVAECLEAGMNGHIAKPIDINNVLKELRKIRQAKPDFTKRDDYEN
ncbi:His Kinase A (phospho-acceptor) domain-containing protein [Treponema bryantii]|uniref:histidine kinase n=1 Tax=Treponema bryantii TaxID=163 RepID=A0A1I3J3D3_9SPIR|nr:response regulator [Treponema bryantii]SFI54525.1 His Kinase A (phospho-acceptor) domain-containing protein [Treponema bryantii]